MVIVDSHMALMVYNKYAPFYDFTRNMYNIILRII